MQIDVIRSTTNVFHRSWFKRWSIINYWRVFTPFSEDPQQLCKELHEHLYFNGNWVNGLRPLIPFECYIESHMTYALSKGVSYGQKFDPADFPGFKFKPLEPWVKDVTQVQIEWTSPIPHQKWYTDLPFFFVSDFTNRLLKALPTVQCEIYGGECLAHQNLPSGSTARFARHSHTAGYVYVEFYNVRRDYHTHRRRIVKV